MSNIITAPPSPDISLGLKVAVTTGRNQLQQNAGNYQALYMVPNSRLVEKYLELQPGESYISSPSEVINNLVVATSGKVALSGTLMSGPAISCQIARFFALDDPLQNYTLTNASTVVVRINLNSVNYAAQILTSTIYYGGSVPPNSYSDPFLKSLLSVQGDKNRTINITSGAGEKMYYAYPVLYGTSNFTVNGFTGGMELVAVVSVSSLSGVQNYYVYESDNMNLGLCTVTVTGA